MSQRDDVRALCVSSVHLDDKSSKGIVSPEFRIYCRCEQIAAALDAARAEGAREASDQAWLGNATCAELLDELRARIEVQWDGLDYSTTGKGKRVDGACRVVPEYQRGYAEGEKAGMEKGARLTRHECSHPACGIDHHPECDQERP